MCSVQPPRDENAKQIRTVLPDLVNLTGAIVAFGQFVGQQPLSMRQLIIATIVWAGLMIAAMGVAGETE